MACNLPQILFFLPFFLIDSYVVSVPVKGMFVFGSSIVDNGNNNYVSWFARADYLPYGIDFPFGPTGRFSNGKNVGDCLAELLQLPLIPCFLPVNSRRRIVYGVNFASGGSGILNSTGSLVGVITFEEQINNFMEVTLPALENQLRRTRTEILPEYLFLIGAGDNDFIYYLTTKTTTPEDLLDFTARLLAVLSGVLRRLYEEGARKFALLSVYPLGCSPVLRGASQTCLEDANSQISYYNMQLKFTVDALQRQLPDSHFVVIDVAKILTDIVEQPTSQGFVEVNIPCCEARDIIGFKLMCKMGGMICTNRTTFVYFDGHHTTEAASSAIASKAFFSNLATEVYPFNIQRLAQL